MHARHDANANMVSEQSSVEQIEGISCPNMLEETMARYRWISALSDSPTHSLKGKILGSKCVLF